jgi:hypothetical protein
MLCNNSTNIHIFGLYTSMVVSSMSINLFLVSSHVPLMTTKISLETQMIHNYKNIMIEMCMLIISRPERYNFITLGTIDVLFLSLGTGMIQHYKFRDCQCILLFCKSHNLFV